MWTVYKNKEYKNLKKQEIQNIFTEYAYFKDLKRITASDKVLRDKAFNIAKNPKYDGYQRGLASMVYKFFDKKTSGSGIRQNECLLDLAEELHKPIIRKFQKRRTYSSLKHLNTIFGC